MIRKRLVSTALAALAALGDARAQDFEKPPPASPGEPLAAEFSLDRAAGFLDRAAVSWTRARKCGACHTNYPYLLARPLLAPRGEVPPGLAEVHRFFRNRAARWDVVKPAFPAEVVATAAALAAYDAATTGTLHPVTRGALDRMWTVQRKDGAWEWLKEDYPPLEADDYFGAVFAAVAAGLAPDGYARGESAREGLARLRRYLKAEPAPNLHHRAWLLWASTRLDDLMAPERRQETIADLLALQRADGSWSLRSCAVHESGPPAESGDGYGTGLAVYVLRQAGLPAADERLRRGIAWLKAHQRESGRWFTPSVNTEKTRANLISNAGTCFAVMALKSCE